MRQPDIPSPGPERVGIGSTLRGALSLYREELLRIALASLAIFIPIDVVTVALHAVEARVIEQRDPSILWIVEVTGVITYFLVTFGQVFLCGVLDELVGAKIEGEPLPGLREVLRKLRFGRLLAADVLISIVTAIAGALLVGPGIVSFALFGITGPVINIEDRRAVDAMRRSVRLVFPHLWTAIAVIAVPLGIELAVDHWYLARTEGAGLGVIVGVSVVLTLTVRALVALLEVVLGNLLIRGDHAVSATSPAE